ncbi:MAG TPA: ABC transporter permease, partial [Thermoanaerobaculia bacterium]|nr:ABC transporter permease [Thermoanaerobaculia bacterium]
MSAAPRKWLEIIRFEIGYQLSRKSTWVVFGAFLVMLMGQTNGQAMNAIDGEILFHAPLALAENGAIMCLVGLLVAAAVAGDAATRDAQLRIESLMHAAPIGRGAYLGGRFIGAFLVVALLLLAIPLAPIVAPFVHPDLEAEHLGTFRPAAYLQTYFLLIAPNAFAGTAILFSLATLVRHTMGSYLGAAFVLIGSVLSRQFIGKTLGRWELAQWLDPMAITTTDVMRKSWSPADLNARMVGLEGALLGNRLLWFVVALGVLAFTYTRFRYGGHAASRRWWQRRGGRVRELNEQPVALHAPIDVPRDFRVAGRLRQTLTIVRDSLREMVTGWSWLVLPFLFVQVATATKMMGHLGTPYLPTTGRVLDSLGGTLNLILVFIVLFAGELVWRERDANMQTLADTVPVPNGVRFAGKLLGLWLVVVALHAVLMLAGVLIQVRTGYYELEPLLYLQILFGLELVEALVFALLALSVHVLVNHKHVGHVVMVLLVMATIVLGALGIEHPLLIYGSDPGWRWSPISGFGPYVGPVLWFELYWAAWTLLLALVAFLFWVRGVQSGVRDRMRTARRRLTGRTIGVAAEAIALVLLVGGFIFYNTN